MPRTSTALVLAWHLAAQEAAAGGAEAIEPAHFLVALCRPFKDGSPYATPATNQQIADELYLTVDAVKTHLRGLFAKFLVSDLPQNQKRASLALSALRTGVVSRRDL